MTSDVPEGLGNNCPNSNKTIEIGGHISARLTFVRLVINMLAKTSVSVQALNMYTDGDLRSVTV